MARILILATVTWSRDAYCDGRNDYLIHCGGCHGTDGVSGVATVPALKNCMKRFLGTKEGRANLLALPGLRAALIRDDARVAEMLNYIAERMEISGVSVPVVTPAQIAEARATATAPSGRRQCH